MTATDDIVKAARAAEIILRDASAQEHHRLAAADVIADALGRLDSKIKRHRWQYVAQTTEQRCIDCGAGYSNGRYRWNGTAPWKKTSAPPCVAPTDTE